MPRVDKERVRTAGGKRASLAAVLLGGLVLCGWQTAHAQSATPADPALIARGEYLTRAGDCAACHTVRGGHEFAGGLAIALPFGNLYSPNITPDRDTGIGSYTDDQFVAALQQGIARDGRHLYPAFPYVAYTLMPREDILAIKAYLFSLPPLTGLTPAGHLQFPFDQRWGMAFWNALFNPDHRFQSDASQSADWNRGAYLVEGPGHCAQCHSPRNVAMAVDNGQPYAGAVTQGWRAYNLTSDTQSGIGGWSDEQLASYLASGHADQRSAAAGPMSEVIENSLRYMTPADIHAMVVYLRTIKPIRNAPAMGAGPASSAVIPISSSGAPSLGERIYASECSNCHGMNGRGVTGSPNAALVGNRTVNDPVGTNLVNVLLEGAQLRTGSGAIVYMPPFGRNHNDDQIAAVANFVNVRFGNGAMAMKGADVAAIRRPAPATIPASLLWGAAAAAAVVVLLIIWAVVALLRRRSLRPA